MRAVCAAIAAHELDSSYPDLELIGNRCYALCVRWFGVPPDASHNCRIIRGPNDCLRKSMITGNYILIVNKTYATAEQLYAVISHEMYHRVINSSKGLARNLWVDELLAFAVTQKTLEEFGFHEQIILRNRHHTKGYALGAEELKKVRKKLSLGLGYGAYPDGFNAGVATLAIKLQAMVEWRSICLLTKCDSWGDWLAALPGDLQYEISDLFAL